jgi:hypothetical protein
MISKFILTGISILIFGLGNKIENTSLLSIKHKQTTPSKEQIINGLKGALNIGIENAVKTCAVKDGFWKNNLIRLPFPEDAIAVKQTAEKFMLQRQVEKFENTLNKAAEEASKEALPIFINAIKNMTINDGLSILNGGEGSATRFLQKNTNAELKTAFKPKVQKAIDQVQLTKYWKPLISNYNKKNLLTGGKDINPDLNTYVTEKALSGLFKLIDIEENKIRKDPNQALQNISNTSVSIVKEVFGSIIKK